MNETVAQTKKAIEIIKVQDISHRVKMDRVLYGRSSAKLEFANSGFVWFMPVEKLYSFKYHAYLETNWNSYGIHGGFIDVKIPTVERDIPNYTGDIPDFALDRLAALRKVGNSIYGITIHSMSPLPVEYRKGDPLMVAWFQENWFEYNTEVLIIALWDGEQEVNIT